MSDLRRRLLSSVEVVNDASSYFKDGADDRRWAETQIGEDSPTGRSRVLINDEKFRRAGAKNYRDKMILAESLHNLKNVSPDIYRKLYISAMNDPKYMDWAKRSYQIERSNGEKRSFRTWHDISRFDQVIGGYLFAGDESIPTMKEWRRGELPIGLEFRGLLESLRNELGLTQ